MGDVHVHNPEVPDNRMQHINARVICVTLMRQTQMQ